LSIKIHNPNIGTTNYEIIWCCAVGTISEGKYADIIAVKGDVLRYIKFTSEGRYGHQAWEKI